MTSYCQNVTFSLVWHSLKWCSVNRYSVNRQEGNIIDRHLLLLSVVKLLVGVLIKS